MHLRRLVLHNFRNVTQAELVPGPGLNILWGENAQGKTNILEAIYLLGHLKSFRGARNDDMIRRDTPFGRLCAEVEKGNTRHSIGLTLQEQGKSVQVDGKGISSSSDFLGWFSSVLFAPEEVSLVRGFPAGRRALLDRAVFQTDPVFLQEARNFHRLLKQRNRLLKEGCHGDHLIPWTEGLIAAGARVRLRRSRYLQRLVPLLQATYRAITDGREEADLIYPDQGEDIGQLEERLRGEIRQRSSRERRLGTTLAGPHRDDPVFTVNGHSLRVFGSQGQQRSFMLAFKTAQIMDLESHAGILPVLLLDDMTGELDRTRQEFFFQFLRSRRGQVFVTTTELHSMIDKGFCDMRSFRVVQGTLLDCCIQ
ncbi:MAG: DNA replication/repair protein RecF [Syntrophotaleaceae bacterium]